MTRPFAAADIGISTSCYHGERLSPLHLDRLDALGFGHIELLANRPHLDYQDPAHRREIVDWFGDRPARPVSVHLPFRETGGPRGWRPLSALSSDIRERSYARDQIKRALEITDQLAVTWVVIHLGDPGQSFNPVLFEYAYAVLDEIRRFAGVEILIETLGNEITGPERIREFLDIAQIPGVGICYDVGHRRPAAEGERFDQVREIHLNDNEGDGDPHLWPFAGTIDWPRLARGLVSAGFGGALVLEGGTPDPDRGRAAANRLARLLAEAAGSPEEFDLKHALKAKSR